MRPEDYGDWIKTYYDSKVRRYKLDDPRFLSDLEGNSRKAFWAIRNGHGPSADGAIECSIHSGLYNLGFGPPHGRKWMKTDDPIKEIKRVMDNGKQNRDK